MCLRLFSGIEAYNYLVDILQVIPTAMLRRLVIPCAIRACVLAYKYNEEAADASEAQTADLAKSLNAQKEETSACQELGKLTLPRFPGRTTCVPASV